MGAHGGVRSLHGAFRVALLRYDGTVNDRRLPLGGLLVLRARSAALRGCTIVLIRLLHCLSRGLFCFRGGLLLLSPVR